MLDISLSDIFLSSPPSAKLSPALAAFVRVCIDGLLIDNHLGYYLHSSHCSDMISVFKSVVNNSETCSLLN
jgi:hypothetical protein